MAGLTGSALPAVVGSGTAWSIVASTVRAELAVRCRSQVLLVQLLALMALCAALSPAPGAGYSVVQIGGRVPLMSANTALIAGAVVLNLLILLGLPLMLDIGRARDARLGAAVLFRSQPVVRPLLALGRFLANAAYGSAFAVVAMLALTSTLAVRFGAPPGAAALALYLLVVAPAVVGASIVGLLIDVVLPPSPLVRTVAAVIAWTALLVAALGGAVDVAGTGAVASLAGVRAANGLALGFVPTHGVATFAWQRLVGMRSVALARAELALVVVALGLAIAAAAGPALHRPARPVRSRGRAVAGGGYRLLLSSTRRSATRPPRSCGPATPGQRRDSCGRRFDSIAAPRSRAPSLPSPRSWRCRAAPRRAWRSRSSPRYRCW